MTSRRSDRPGAEPFPLADRLFIDVLEVRYGPVHPEIRRHDHRLRETFIADRKRVPLTYALTFLARPMPAEAREVDAEIRRGALMGKAFLDQGYDVRKNVIDVSIIELPRWLAAAFGSDRGAMSRSAEFYARRPGSAPFIYGIVTEIYSPECKPPLVSEVDVSQLSALTPELQRVGFSKDQIWETLGKANDWGDFRARHDRARVASVPLILDHRRRLALHLLQPHQRREFLWKLSGITGGNHR